MGLSIVATCRSQEGSAELGSAAIARSRRLQAARAAEAARARGNRPLLLNALAVARGALGREDATVVVLGAAALRSPERARRAAPRNLNHASAARIAYNALWRAGLASSLRVGLDALRARHRRTRDGRRSTGRRYGRASPPDCGLAQAAPRSRGGPYASRRRARDPPRRLWHAAQSLEGDVGARALLRSARELTLAGTDTFYDLCRSRVCAGTKGNSIGRRWTDTCRRWMLLTAARIRWPAPSRSTGRSTCPRHCAGRWRSAAAWFARRPTRRYSTRRLASAPADWGCEPASTATVAGLRKLVQDGVIAKDETVACVLTGHVLKDPDATVAYHTADPTVFEAKLGKRGVKRASFANRTVQVPNDLAEIVKAIELYA